jgi:hypothetical protein
MNPPIKLLAGAALLAGTLRIVAAFIPYVPNSTWLELLYATIDLGMLFGLLGLASIWGNAWNAASTLSFGVALSGLSLIIGPDPKVFGIDFYIAGSAIYLLGLSGISTCLLYQRRVQIPAVFWLLCFGASLATLAVSSPLIVMGAGITLSLGFIGLAVNLWQWRQVHV